ncbi:MAG TPA: Asd/ArgC dimerization domain-containing protein [Thermoanaerobaculia bacterium]|nr:Asd/ArgC dimerization domain-containing protein [Thermoanaerobaculia bacterium]
MSVLAIVHPTNLVGREVRETLDRRPGLGREIRLLSTREEEVGTLAEVGGAAAFVQRYDALSVEGVDLAFFCGSAADLEAALGTLPPAATALFLATDSRSFEGIEQGRPVVSGVNTEAAERGAVLLSPHPAVILLAHLLHALRGLEPLEAVATVVQPASMQGNPGLDELFEQSRQIVAMTERRPTPIFGAQLAFNLMPTQAPAAPLAAELGRVLPGLPPVALQVLQGGIFHSLSASLFVRLGGAANAKAVHKVLGEHPQIELVKKPSHLGPIDAAADERVLVGAVHEEPAVPGGFWIWAVMDNLTRGGAVNAVEIAEAVL